MQPKGWLGCAAIALAACQPLYGDKPEKLTALQKKKKPPEAAETAPDVKYIDDCIANFRDDPKRVFRDSSGSTTLAAAGDEALAQADKSKEPQGQAELVRVSIDKYRNALIKDPYNAEATLKLAVAYDRVLRKGCALKLLQRIAALEGNPKFQREAKRAADQVNDTKEWFRGYRKDAVQAVGR